MNLQKDNSGNNCIVTTLSCVRPHNNADRLQLATVLGTTVIVGLDARDGDIVLYFDSNLRLSHDYLHYNNQYSNPDMNADTSVKGYFPKTGRVKSQKFRGEVSNGYVAEINSLTSIPSLKESGVIWEQLNCPDWLDIGDEFTSINDIEICSKYVPVNSRSNLMKGTTGKFNKISDMFHRHWDTKQLMREKDSIPVGPLYIEEKIHGTSGRTGNVLCDIHRPWWKFWKPRTEWRVISGTRRVDNIDYHLPEIRAEIEHQLAPHLRKGEQVYYEIFGNNVTGAAIQSGFSYGCRGGEYKAMLYRVTITTVDGWTYDLDRQQVHRRAEELGLMKPILLGFNIVNDKSEIDYVCEIIIQFAGGKSALDAGTLREGVVVWFQDDAAQWRCLKYKGEEFLMKESKNRDKGIDDCEEI